MRFSFLSFRAWQRFRGRVNPLPWILAAGFVAGGIASAQTLTTLVNFSSSTVGGYSVAPLIADENGNLLGTTLDGPAPAGQGTVFMIAKTSSGYASIPTVLVAFSGANGAYPRAGLIADASGNLFGTTSGGGAFDGGTVFKIEKTTTGYATTPTILVNFNPPTGAYPWSGLIADANGNLYGATSRGGAFNGGTVFKIEKTTTGYATTPTVLANFNQTTGMYPLAGLIADSNGNLFGTTSQGSGALNEGTVFEIEKTTSGYATTPTVLASFDYYTSGSTPYAGLIADSNGNLFGTTSKGGTSRGGTVFKIEKTTTGYANTLLFWRASTTTPAALIRSQA